MDEDKKIEDVTQYTELLNEIERIQAEADEYRRILWCLVMQTSGQAKLTFGEQVSCPSLPHLSCYKDEHGNFVINAREK